MRKCLKLQLGSQISVIGSFWVRGSRSLELFGSLIPPKKRLSSDYVSLKDMMGLFSVSNI
jgi:hypothetical protein